MRTWLLSAVLWVSACAPSGGSDDDGASSGGDSAAPTALQPLRVATFNADWLWSTPGDGEMPRNAVDYEMVGRLLTDHGLQLVGLQEVDGVGALYQLGLDGDWEWVTGDSGWNQNVAIAWRDDLVSVSNVYEVTLPGYTGANKKPLFAEVESRDGDLAFTFMVIHHHPFTDDDSAQERAAQAAQLHTWLTETLPGVASAPRFADNVVLVGDFNDTFGALNAGWPSLTPFTDDPGWDFATAYTTHYTQIGYQSQIDHIALTTPMIDRWVDPQSRDGVHVIPHEQLEPWSNYPGGFADPWPTISDHRPVWIGLEHGP